MLKGHVTFEQSVIIKFSQNTLKIFGFFSINAYVTSVYERSLTFSRLQATSICT